MSLASARYILVLLLLAVLAACTTTGSIQQDGPYAFSVDLQNLKLPIVPATVRRPLSGSDRLVARLGHFYAIGADGIPGTIDDYRVRLFGVNLPRDWLFPENRAEASRIATGVSALGFNAVRLIGLDMQPAGDVDGIFRHDANGYAGVDGVMLKRLAMLLDALGEQGLRATLVLRSAYTFSSDRDCFRDKGVRRCVPDARLAAGGYRSHTTMPEGSRPLDIFNTEMLFLQKRFMQDLLAPLLKYPALALIEINNENSLIPLAAGMPDRLPPLYAQELDQLWNRWLADKYRDRQALLEAWEPMPVASPAGQSTSTGNVSTGGSAWKSKIEKGISVFRQSGLHISDGRVYRVVVENRGSPGARVQFALFGSGSAGPLSGRGRLLLAENRDGSMAACFRATGTGDNVTLVLSAGQDTGFLPGTVSLLETVATASSGLMSAAETTDTWQVARPPPMHAVTGCPMPHRVYLDYLQFLSDTESAYYAEMTAWLRDELGVDLPISGSQANYGGLEGQLRLAEATDYLDIHYYWDHPRIPSGRQDAWRMQNKPMVEDPDGGIVPHMVSNHVLGKPLVISELSTNHASRYATDGYALAIAFAAHQDIDGLYLFNYYRGQHSLSAALRPGRLTHWYAVNGDSRVSAVIPVLARMFLNADVAPATNECVLDVDRRTRQLPLVDGYHVRNIHKVLETNGNSARWLKDPNTPPDCRFLLKHLGQPNAAPGQHIPDTGQQSGVQVQWQHGPADADSYLAVNTAHTWLVAGYLPDRLQRGGVTFRRMTPSGTYGLVAVISADGLPIESSGALLFINTGAGQNRHSEIVSHRDGAIACVTSDGKHCSHPFWAREAGEFVLSPLVSTLQLETAADVVSAERLDETGRPAGSLRVTRAAEGYLFLLDGNHDRTPWYRVILAR